MPNIPEKVSNAIVDISKDISSIVINEVYSKIIFSRSLKWIFYSSFKMSILCNEYDESAVHSKILSSVYTIFSSLKQLIITNGYKCKKLSNKIMDYLNKSLRPFLAKWDHVINHSKKSNKIKNGVIKDKELENSFKKEIEKIQKEANEITNKIKENKYF